MTGAESANTLIPARTRRQAMDWSLVLVSQGIECVIQQADGDWALVVEPQDYARALATLRQYRIENRGWHWRQKMPWPEISFHWGVIAWCLVLAAVHWLDALPGSRLGSAGMMNAAAVANGAWWRLFTATMLHFDLAHLMANLVIGFPVLGLAMGRYGPACALLAAYLAGAGGNVAGLLLHSRPYHGLGASGMVMGGLGLLAVQSLALRFKNPHSWKYIIGGLLGGFMLFTLLALDPASDVIAHFGGFVCGLAFGAAITLVPQRKLLASPANALCGAILTALVTLTWMLALRHASPNGSSF